MLSKAEINTLVKALTPAISEAVERANDQILNVEKAAELIGTTKKAIYHKVANRAIPYNKVDGSLYFSKNALIKHFLNQ